MRNRILEKLFNRPYIFLTKPDEIEKYVKTMKPNFSDNCVHGYNFEILNLFDSGLQPINTKPMIKNKSKQLLSELKKLKVQTILVLTYKRRNDSKIFHLSVKLIARDSDIDESFTSMHQSITMKIKHSAAEYWKVNERITKHIIKIFER